MVVFRLFLLRITTILTVQYEKIKQNQELAVNNKIIIFENK